MKSLGIINTYEEWLEEYISWKKSRLTNPTPMMTRREYFQIHFPKNFNPRQYYDQIERIKEELIRNGVIKQ